MHSPGCCFTSATLTAIFEHRTTSSCHAAAPFPPTKLAFISEQLRELSPNLCIVPTRSQHSPGAPKPRHHPHTPPDSSWGRSSAHLDSGTRRLGSCPAGTPRGAATHAQHQGGTPGSWHLVSPSFSPASQARSQICSLVAVPTEQHVARRRRRSRKARSPGVQVSQEAKQAALIIPGDCITSALFGLGFFTSHLLPAHAHAAFNPDGCRRRAACAPQLRFAVLCYGALLPAGRPHSLSQCKHTTPSIALHESAAWNSWHFSPFFSPTFSLEERFLRASSGSAEHLGTREGFAGAAKRPGCRHEHQLQFSCCFSICFTTLHH